MQAQSQLTRQTITLKGSTKTVTEFFGYAVNSILFQRGIYGPEVRAEPSAFARVRAGR